MSRRQPENSSDVLEGKIFALLSYLSILCILPLIFKKENSFCLHHGKQGIVIFVAQVAVFILHIALGTWFLRLGMFLLGVISFIGIISVLEGRYLKLPVICDFAEKLTI